MSEHLADLADEYRRESEDAEQARLRLRSAVLEALWNGMTPTQVIAETGLSRRTVYIWINSAKDEN